MSRKSKINIALLILAIILSSSMYFAQAETKEFSAYAACREQALRTQGYAVWKHTKTIPLIFMSTVEFFDGFNSLTCDAFGVGPFWFAGSSIQTLVGCATNLSDPPSLCPENYYGVSP